MDRFRSALAFIAALAIMVPAGSTLAAKAYTTDTQELPLRVAPSSGAKTLLTVPPSSAVELVNPNSYTKVRFGKPDGQTREGWIASRFLSAMAAQFGSRHGTQSGK